jgi:hypothetical protein
VSKPFAVAAVLLLLSTGMASAQTAAPSHLLKAGTVIDTTLDQDLSSKTNHNGDSFTLTPNKGGFWKKEPDVGSCIFLGHLANVTPAGPTHKATMTAILDGMKCPPSDNVNTVSLQLLSAKTFEPKTHLMRDTAIVVSAAVAGHIAAGKSHGGLAGAAGGVALASTLKSDIVIKQGTVLTVKLLQPIVVPATPQK